MSVHHKHKQNVSKRAESLIYIRKMFKLKLYINFNVYKLLQIIMACNCKAFFRIIKYCAEITVKLPHSYS